VGRNIYLLVAMLSIVLITACQPFGKVKEPRGIVIREGLKSWGPWGEAITLVHNLFWMKADLEK
jgi:hypothetical protein